MTPLCRQRFRVAGVVQGVGFRPFVARLATRLQLGGWVCNTPQGACIEVEGLPEQVQRFAHLLATELPAPALLQRLEVESLLPQGDTAFCIRSSQLEGLPTAHILPDLATCGDCLRELFDANDRRYLYPFINCTHCGPRFSIITALPYDRDNTSMRHFAMCPACQAEYDAPHNRRFHAQPNACPQCGPQLSLWDVAGQPCARQHAALLGAIEALRGGAIVAVKGLGGFHLLVLAQQQEAVQRLRQRKQRAAKPFAMLYPSLAAVQQDCQVTDSAAAALCSPAAPIVLLRKQRRTDYAAVAPDNPYLGVMLPSNPLHHLLLEALQCPVVATSGNRAEEPLCIAEEDVCERLAGLAEVFLVHNRPIVHHVDDSLVGMILGQPTILRRARGYAPLPVRLPEAPAGETPHAVLAVGGQQKNTVAVTVGKDILLSQHLGDLHTPQALRAWHHTVTTLPALYAVQPAVVACDAHPDYVSTRQAQTLGIPLLPVQHHYAHVLACMAENGVAAPALGIAWDGTGYGTDGSLWGGEFLVITPDTFQRRACLRPFPLPGGSAAIREPRRAALGLLYTLYGEALWSMADLALWKTFQEAERRVLRRMLQRRLQTPLMSSIGRLFDAVAALLGICQENTFEGQAAMALEWVQDGAGAAGPYPVQLDRRAAVWQLDWAPMLGAMLQELRQQRPVAYLATTFHHTLVAIIVAVAEAVGLERVVLSGGCFQNRTLTEGAIRQLRAAGFTPFWHQQVPPNDGGLALGQVIAAWRAWRPARHA